MQTKEQKKRGRPGNEAKLLLCLVRIAYPQCAAFCVLFYSIFDFQDPSKEGDIVQLKCPLAKAWFKDPVVTPGDQNYERSAIKKYMKDNKDQHPQSGRVLKPRELIGNIALKEFMDIFQGGKWDHKVCTGSN